MKMLPNNTPQEAPQSKIKTWGRVMFIFIALLLVVNTLSAFFDWNNNSVAYYKLDEVSGSIIDSVGGVYQGTNLYAVAGANGKIGKAYSFNGTANHAYISLTTQIPTLHNWSISLWTNESDPKGAQSAFSLLNFNGISMQLLANGSYNQRIRYSGTYKDFYFGLYQNNTYQHQVLTYNGTFVSFYLNGTLVGTESFTGYEARGLVADQIGSFDSISGWNGTIDEIAVFNRTFNSQDVTDLYRNGNGLGYQEGGVEINLTSPVTGSTKVNSTIVFNATYNSTSSGFALINTTYHIWHSNGTSFNNTYLVSITGTDNSTSVPFTFTNLGDYVWNTKVCIGDGFPLNCTFKPVNNTFTYQTFSIDGESYNTPVFEGTSQNFTLNITKGTDFSISYVTLVYNGTGYNGTFEQIEGNSYKLRRELTIPSVSANTDLTFFWNVTFQNDVVYNSTTNTQTVNNLGLDDCSVNTVQILNFTMLNEDNQVGFVGPTNNTTIEIDLDLFSTFTSTTPIIEFSQLYNNTLPARVCISNAIANSTYFMTTQVFYKANNFAEEYYNIQKYSLNASAGSSQNITLYDLNKSVSQIFKISFKDESFLPVEGALIQIQRKYVSEGVFKTVEIPITDAKGEAIGNLVRDDIIYSFTVTKNGKTLGIFPNVFAVCQNPTITECKIDLNSFASTITVGDFFNDVDFDYTLTYDNTTRTISSTFSIPSGVPSTILLNVTKEDALGTQVCTNTLISSAGTLNCVVGNSFGNTTVLASLYKDGTLIAQGQIKLDQDPKQLYGNALMFLGLILMLTLIGAGISDNPIYTTVFLMLGVILLFALNLVANNGFIGGTATVLWILIAIVLVIIKGANRN